MYAFGNKRAVKLDRWETDSTYIAELRSLVVELPKPEEHQLVYQFLG